jgi:aminoglycoside phosphotransferase (APT) family kinase protein
VRSWNPLSLPSPELWPADTPVADVARTLDAELGLRTGTCVPVRPPRAEARSTIYFLGTADRPDQCRWVVKQSRTSWRQDDLASPVTAEWEFAQLSRLAAYFKELDGPARVPEPIAALPSLRAFAMAYVPGGALSDLLSSRSHLRPAALMDGVGRAAGFLRRLHDIQALPARSVALGREAQGVLALMERSLGPAGLAAPPAVARALRAVPDRTEVTRQVWLHGDFTPANLLLPDDRTIVGIDIDLQRTGSPEDDLARFVAFTSGAMPFMGDVALPAPLRRHRSLEFRLMEAYGGDISVAVLELRLLAHLSLRWLRLRQLACLYGRSALLPSRLRAIGVQMQSLMLERTDRLRAVT